MTHFAVNWLAVILATVASMALGFLWYTALSNQWLAASGRKAEDIDSSDFMPYVWSALGQLIMAYFLALLTPTLTGETTIGNGMLVGAHMWLGFIITTMIINHRYEGRPWSLTAINGGYFLGVLLLQGVVIGLFG